jgi:hypothetical protein
MARLPLLALLLPVACASPRALVTTSTPAPPYEGSTGNAPWASPQVIAPAEPGSLEATFVPLRGPYRFVDLAKEAPGARKARFLGFTYEVAPWSQIFDGALVFRTVTPTTRLAAPPTAAQPLPAASP